MDSIARDMALGIQFTTGAKVFLIYFWENHKFEYYFSTEPEVSRQ